MAASKVWVMSDPHLFHKFVSELRGFDTPEEFNAVFEDDWRSKVEMQDQVWLLGDLTGGGHIPEALELIRNLPGEKHLIIGNHDGCFPDHRNSHRKLSMYFDTFASVQLHARRRIDGINCMVSHFPYHGDHTEEIRYDQWRLADHGLPIIHGHTHSSDILSFTDKGTPQINVAWEATKGLVTFDSLYRYTTKGVDHHGVDLAELQLLVDRWWEIWKKNSGFDPMHPTNYPQAKLTEEVEEFLETMHPVEQKNEAADIIIVLLTQMHYWGFPVNSVLDAVASKLHTNIHRTWAKNPDGTISHVESSDG